MVTALLVELPGSPFADRMALFQHVLLNDAQWSPVLKQKVKLSAFSPPMYARFNSNDEDVDKIELMTVNDDQHPTAMYVIQKLMDSSSLRSGTNVNFTSYVLGTAVSCFTYNNVSFVLMLLVDRIGMLVHNIGYFKNKEEKEEDKKEEVKEKENKKKNKNKNKKKKKKKKKKKNMTIKELIDETLDDVRMTFEVFVDKVAAVDGELAFFANALHDYDDAKRKNDDLLLFNVLEMVKKEVDKRLDEYCYLTPHTEVYEYLGMYATLDVSAPSPDKLTPDDSTLRRELDEFQKVINCMLDVYDGLDVETMSMKTWIQILQYDMPINMAIKLYTDDKNEKPNPDEVMSERLKEVIKKYQEE